MTEVLNKAVAIEYPRPNETIGSNDYVFRVAAMPGVKTVELSIDESGWLPCRQAGDSWCYDWSDYDSGEHEAVARIQLANGEFHATERRFFTAELEHSDRPQHCSVRRSVSRAKA